MHTLFSDTSASIPQIPAATSKATIRLHTNRAPILGIFPAESQDPKQRILFLSRPFFLLSSLPVSNLKCEHVSKEGGRTCIDKEKLT